MFRRLFGAFSIVSALLGGFAFGASPVEIEAFLQASPEGKLEILAKASPEDRLEMISSLSYLVESDPLTGLNNRRALSRLQDSAVKAADKVAFVVLDLDFFKKVNDTYGHEAGDEVLRKIAEVAKANTREVIVRIGGEEIVIAVVGGELSHGLAIAERLRRKIELIEFSSHPGLKVTASFGVAAGVAESAMMWDALQKAADEALYAAKQNGRNRVESASSMRACEILASQK